MKWLIIITTIFSFNAFAIPHNVEIDSKLIVNGKKLGSPRILTLNGKKAQVMLHDQKQKKGYNLEFRPIMVEGKKVLLKYSVAIKEQGNETLSRGEVKVPYDQNGRISLDKGKVQIHFKVKKS